MEKQLVNLSLPSGSGGESVSYSLVPSVKPKKRTLVENDFKALVNDTDNGSENGSFDADGNSDSASITSWDFADVPRSSRGSYILGLMPRHVYMAVRKLEFLFQEMKLTIDFYYKELILVKTTRRALIVGCLLQGVQQIAGTHSTHPI
jgi:hypothetical protein